MKHDLAEIAPGKILYRLSESEVAANVERWMACFGKNSEGIHIDQFMWHVFSNRRFPSVSRAAALEQYPQHEAHEYVVLSNDRDGAFTTDIRPMECSLSDWLVFPANLAWTMAFTHEDEWLGPYFARHPQFSALDAENRARIKKAREAERARQKGWA